jgi:hypothetical protein
VKFDTQALGNLDDKTSQTAPQASPAIARKFPVVLANAAFHAPAPVSSAFVLQNALCIGEL